MTASFARAGPSSCTIAGSAFQVRLKPMLTSFRRSRIDRAPMRKSHAVGSTAPPPIMLPCPQQMVIGRILARTSNISLPAFENDSHQSKPCSRPSTSAPELKLLPSPRTITTRTDGIASS
jgi:hypothetical protein